MSSNICNRPETWYTENSHREALPKDGQVAQLVERSPEKAGVGGSTPSLATILFSDLRIIATFDLRPIASTSLYP